MGMGSAASINFCSTSGPSFTSTSFASFRKDASWVSAAPLLALLPARIRLPQERHTLVELFHVFWRGCNRCNACQLQIH